MKLTTAFLPLLATLTTASPTNSSLFEEVALIPADVSTSFTNGSSLQVATPPGQKRGNGWVGIYYCRNNGWRAPCAHTWIQINQCMNFPRGWDNNINSFGPDPGSHYCILHSQPGCKGGEPKFRIRHPGTAKTSEYGIDRTVSSVRCNY